MMKLSRFQWLIIATLTGAPLVVPATAQTTFEDVSDQLGDITGTTSSGAYWVDVNGDHWPDLFLPNHTAAPLLLMNDQQGGFTDMSASLQGFDPEADMHGASWADFDNDGDQDLLVLTGSQHGTGASENLLFVNDAGILTNSSSAYGLDYPTSEGQTPQWIDFDGNGLLDAIVSTTLGAASKNVLYRQTAQGVFAAGDTLQQVAETSLFSLLRRGEDGSQNLLLHSFIYPKYQYEWDNGASPIDVIPDSESSLARDAVLTDLFNDGKFELIVAESDAISSDRVIQVGTDSLVAYLNGGDGTRIRFRSNATVTVQMSPSTSISANNIYLGTALNAPATLVEDGVLVTFSVNHSDGSASGAPASILPDALHMWRADGEYWYLQSSAPIGLTIKSPELVDEVSLQDGTTRSDGASWLFEWQNGRWQKIHRYKLLDSCQSIASGDMDNNGLIDLVHLCGPGNEGFLQISYYFEIGTGEEVTYEVRNSQRIPTQLAISNESVTLVDYDRDGFLDIFLTNGKGFWPWAFTGSNRLYRNTGTSNNWSKISLEGTSSNRDGTGALVKLKSGGIWQYRIRDNGGHAAAQNEPVVHFGLGAVSSIDSLIVEWPSGQVQHLSELPANRELIVTEGDPAVVVSSEQRPLITETNQMAVYPNPVEDTVSLEYSNECAMESEIGVYALDGRLVISRAIGSTTGAVKTTLEVGGLPSGVYLVRRTACATSETARFVKL